MMRAILYGLAASLFFAFTFILNRSMELTGGSWAWSASLRFIFMLPMLILLVVLRGKLHHSLSHLYHHGRAYLLWGTVGFGLFYAPLCLAARYGEGWLVAGSWQVTIVAGTLLLPLLRQTNGEPTQRSGRTEIPWRALGWSTLILLGVLCMQIERTIQINILTALACLLPVILAALMYPLGNRKMMGVCGNEVDTFERVLNMTLASMPFWLLLSLYAWQVDGVPHAEQMQQAFLVALLSGVIATLLFFSATNQVKEDAKRLAAVEATQSGEVLFALLGEIILLSAPLPAALSLFGIALVIVGMILHCITRTKVS